MRTVRAGSPGAQAGIAIGDVILSINGSPVVQPGGVEALSEIGGSEAFTRAPGTRVTLTLQHGDIRRTVSLTLRNIL